MACVNNQEKKELLTLISSFQENTEELEQSPEMGCGQFVWHVGAMSKGSWTKCAGKALDRSGA